MNLLALRRTRLLSAGKLGAGAFALVLSVGACGSSTTTTNTSSGNTISGTINGSGSTFQAIFEQSLINGFKSVQGGVTITYDGTGSTAGKKALAQGTADFAGTDSPVKDTEKSQFGGKALLYVPLAGGPIAVAYNVSGIDKLQLSPATLANIFQGKIKRWNDTAVKTDNPGASLPSTSITIVHRSDGSGTTSNFTKYLAKAAPNDFTLTPGETVDWPAGSVGAAKNPGVANAVKQTGGAIGYVDYSTAVADKLAMASIKNANGEFVAPTLEGATKALEAATVSDDLTFSPLDQSGAGVYPITSPTWILVYQQQTDAAKGNALKAYLQYVLGDGQQLAASSQYAALPQSLAQKATAQLDKLQIG